VESRKLEEELAEQITETKIEADDAAEDARKRLPVKTEIRIQAQIDPVVEETRRFRQMADEVDERYARYDKLVDKSDGIGNKR
jgi:23S rRNA A2030 N6-methylase RlmJ